MVAACGRLRRWQHPSLVLPCRRQITVTPDTTRSLFSAASNCSVNTGRLNVASVSVCVSPSLRFVFEGFDPPWRAVANGRPCFLIAYPSHARLIIRYRITLLVTIIINRIVLKISCLFSPAKSLSVIWTVRAILNKRYILACMHISLHSFLLLEFMFFSMCCAVCLELTSRVCHRKRLIVCIQI